MQKNRIRVIKSIFKLMSRVVRSYFVGRHRYYEVNIARLE
jgi:hypothetical protein